MPFFTMPSGSPSFAGRSNRITGTLTLTRWAAICAPMTPAPSTATLRTIIGDVDMWGTPAEPVAARAGRAGLAARLRSILRVRIWCFPLDARRTRGPCSGCRIAARKDATAGLPRPSCLRTRRGFPRPRLRRQNEYTACADMIHTLASYEPRIWPSDAASAAREALVELGAVALDVDEPGVELPVARPAVLATEGEPPAVGVGQSRGRVGRRPASGRTRRRSGPSTARCSGSSRPPRSSRCRPTPAARPAAWSRRWD